MYVCVRVCVCVCVCIHIHIGQTRHELLEIGIESRCRKLIKHVVLGLLFLLPARGCLSAKTLHVFKNLLVVVRLTLSHK